MNAQATPSTTTNASKTAVKPKATVKKVIAKKSPVKTPAKPATKPTAPKTAPAKAEKKAIKVAMPQKPVMPTKPAKAEKPAKVKKPKLVRDSFTIPKDEYEVIDVLKVRGGKLGQAVKKSELLRAGIKALAAMSDIQFKAALIKVPTIKTGRPTNAK